MAAIGGTAAFAGSPSKQHPNHVAKPATAAQNEPAGSRDKSEAADPQDRNGQADPQDKSEAADPQDRNGQADPQDKQDGADAPDAPESPAGN
jgi:hypothetical protein